MGTEPRGAGSTAVPEWVLPAALDGERVDRAVALLTGATRAAVADLVAAGGVRIGGDTVRTRARRVRTGDVLSAELAPDPHLVADGLAADPSVEFTVVYEDADLVVVDKPAGLVVHPGNGNRSGTLVAGLLARYPDLAALEQVVGAEYRPGIVHRLDKGTSGLLVVARTLPARSSLVAQLAAHQVDRRYQALVGGTVEADEGMVDAPLARSEKDPTAMAVRLGGREARTRYRVVARYSEPVSASLLECRLETGRTHQIRVHMAAIGHPVVGDDRYDGTPPRATKPNRLLPPGRLWLHAAALEFSHPASARHLRFTAPLPADLRGSLAGFS